MDTKRSILFIGGGTMAQAIIKGMASASLAVKVAVSEPIAERRAEVAQLGVATTASNTDTYLRAADIVILAVKPQNLQQVATEIRDALTPEQTVVSILAGTSVARLSFLLHHERIIRVMPNMPMQVQQGMSVWFATSSVSEDTLHVVQQTLSALGDELLVPKEDFIDAATAISGSGPAYVFMFLESLEDAGVALGMTAADARRLAVQTVLGAAALAQITQEHPAALKTKVTSPGGTTIAAIAALEKAGFRAVVMQGVSAAFARSQQLNSEDKDH